MRPALSIGILVALTFAVPAPGRAADEATCRHAVAKGSAKFVSSALKSMQSCLHRVRAGKLPGRSCRLLAASTGDLQTDAALAEADSQLTRALAPCSGGALASIGFESACRDTTPGTPFGRADLARCLTRTHRAAVQGIIRVQFPDTSDHCGNGVVEFDEDCDPAATPTGCDPGEVCQPAGAVDECLCEDAGTSSCGDGVVDPGEQCDPGATPSGCPAGNTCIAAGQANQCTCATMTSTSCTGECTPGCNAGQTCACQCASGTCGNGVVDAGEQCDPLKNPSGCAAGLVCGSPGNPNQCTCFSGTGTCGNGMLDPGEGCDPALPNTCDPGEVCLESGAMACTCGAPPAACGNGLIEWGEQCDPAAHPTGCAAGATCGAAGTATACACSGGSVPVCGNGKIETGEECDPAATPTGCAAGEACAADCTCATVSPTCGNGTVDADEECDPAARPTGCAADETCGADCTCGTAPRCGDGTVDPGEACDPAATPTGCPTGMTCSASCTCAGGGGGCNVSPQPSTLTFTTATGSGACGQVTGAATALPLTCGDLYFGGSRNISVPPAPTPGGAPSVFDVASCSGSKLTLAAGAGSGKKDCTKAGCFFGPPLPIPNGPLSTCVVNSFSGDASGTLDASSGSTQITMGLKSAIFLTGDNSAPCPICNGTCQAGANAGHSCTVEGSKGTSPDCPPDPIRFVSNLSVSFAPLTTGTATRSGPSFCSGQANPGAFGNKGNTITENGKPASGVGSSPTNVTLVGIFCIPATGNGALDPVADLPGPGAISLPGTFTAH